MQDIRTILNDLLKQVAVSDFYAAQENESKVPSVWQLQNSLLREKAHEALRCVTSQIT